MAKSPALAVGSAASVARRAVAARTEAGSAALYSDRYPFQTIVLGAPYTPERYIKAMERALAGGFLFMIVDSGSHEWGGPGGCLSIIDGLKGSGNEYVSWGKITPRHDKWVEWIKDCPIHIITTLRAKVKYVLEENEKGKKVPRKIGLEAVMREGFDYEMSVAWMIDENHVTRTDKDRTDLFGGGSYDLRSPEVAMALHEWRENGADYVPRSIFPLEDKVDKAKAQPPAVNQTRTASQFDLVTPEQAADIWKTAVAADKTEADVKRYLWTKLGIESLKKIPAARGKEVKEWAGAPMPAKTFAAGEEEARAVAALLQVSEVDLSAMWAECRGDWDKVKASLSADAERDDIVQELATQ